ncbi:MAG: tRNA (adenosine(37)-N6)-dimethylallyltransferase MiaA [Marinilabiliales bacterium]|nr:MAG: tRNA (adenosine(37)-N6)-dimethylallyltransferase MiaA [Marinilabiliales bacterium]
MGQKTLVILFGPTGVGKTDLSINLAQHFNSDIFSCDSRQFYKELGVGVAKPDNEQLQKVKHHFINSVSIHYHYSISQFETDTISKLHEYFKNRNIAFMVGGSGLYIDAITNGVDIMPDHDEKIRQEVIDFYKENGLEAIRFELKRIDPVYYEQVDLKNPQRILRAIEMFRLTGKPFSEFRKNKKIEREFQTVKVGINLDREILYKRINDRVDKMFQEGLLHEARDLYQFKGLVALKTIGYTELFSYIENEQNLDKTVELVKRNSRHYARRQLTWFRRYKDTEWFSPDNYKQIINFIESKINN